MPDCALHVPDDCREAILQMLSKELGWAISDRDRERLDRVLRQRIAERAVPDLESYHKLLSTQDGRRQEFPRLVEQFTVGETHFFRNTGQIDLLRQRVLPELTRRQQRNPGRRRRLDIWCAGCATGQEPYTLAMLVQEELRNPQDWDIRIIGTDINRQFLQVAEQASYSGWQLRGLDQAQLERHLDRQGEQWRIKPHLRDMVSFAQHNLASDGPAPIHSADLILCRNLFIYLTNDAISHAMRQFQSVLRELGYLFTGPGELIGIDLPGFRPESLPEGVLYRRTTRQAAKPPPMPAAIASPRQPVEPPPLPAPDRRAAPAHREAVADPAAQGETSVESELVRAQQSAREGDYPAALTLLRSHLRSYPLDHLAHYRMAHVLELTGNNREALQALHSVIYLAADFIPGYLDYAAVAYELGMHDKAQRHRRSALRMLQAMPDETVVWPYEGLTAGELGSYVAGQLEDSQASPGTET